MRNDNILKAYCNKCELRYRMTTTKLEASDCYTCFENLRSDAIPEGIIRKYRIKSIKD